MPTLPVTLKQKGDQLIYIEEIEIEEDDTFLGLPELPEHSTHQLLEQFVHDVNIKFDAPAQWNEIVNNQQKREEAYR